MGAQHVSYHAADPLLPLGYSLGDLLVEAARRWTDQEAVVFAAAEDDDVRWTFSDLEARSAVLAAGLAAAGYRPGERVAVWAPNEPEWILLEWAAARAGLVLVTLNPLYRAAELEFALAHAEVAALFHADELAGVRLRDVVEPLRHRLPALREVFSLTEDVATLAESGKIVGYPLPAVAPDEVAMIQFTSGTTGVPKAAQLTHAGLATTARAAHVRWDVGPGCRIAHGFPLFHVGGSGILTPGTAAAGCTTLPMHIFEAGAALELLERERCCGFLGVPTMLIAMLEHPSLPSLDLSALRFVVLGGAPLPLELVQRIQSTLDVEVLNVYGQTECSGVTTSALPEDSPERKAQTVGIALPGVSLKIVDSGGATVRRGEPGELCYQGPGAMAGYVHEATSSVVDADGWLHTGDRATMDGAGYVRIVGRVKEMVIRGGENLSPPEIENVVLAHPAVAEVAVVGVPDARYGEELCAAVRFVPGAAASEDEIRAHCTERLSRWKVPRYVVPVESFPLTPSGKVRKFLLRKAMVDRLGLSELEGANP